MLKYDRSDPELRQREILGTRLYMASHPKMQQHFRDHGRPRHFGTKVWESSLCMLHHLHNRPLQRVLELGCGWGLVGVHLARSVGATVTCMDADESLAGIVELHAGLNGVHVDFLHKAFGELEPQDLQVDTLVGVEICYSESVCQEICEAFEVAKESGVQQALILDPGRPDFDDLVDFCKQHFSTSIQEIQLPQDSRTRYLLQVDFQAG